MSLIVSEAMAQELGLVPLTESYTLHDLELLPRVLRDLRGVRHAVVRENGGGHGLQVWRDPIVRCGRYQMRWTVTSYKRRPGKAS